LGANRKSDTKVFSIFGETSVVSVKMDENRQRWGSGHKGLEEMVCGRRIEKRVSQDGAGMDPF